MPRLIEQDWCPHCRARLPEPKPRACAECGGSLQQRYLKAGCLSSAPPAVFLWLLARGVWRVWAE
jgi:predicted amidophosphoribosyltransferase